MDTTLTISTNTPQYSLLSYFGHNTDYIYPHHSIFFIELLWTQHWLYLPTPLNILYWVTLDTTLTISTHTTQYSLLSYYGHNTDYIYPHPSIFFTGLLWTQHWLYLPTPLNILYWVTLDTTLTISTHTTQYSLLSNYGHNTDYIYPHPSIFFIELLWTQHWLYLPTPLNILYWVTLDTSLTISTHTPQYSLLSYYGHNTDYISTHTPQYSLLSYFGDNTDYTPLNIHYWVTLDTTLTISTNTPQYSLLSYFGHNTDYIYPHPSIFFTGLLWTQHWLYLPTPLNILYWVTMDTTLTISTHTPSIFFIELLWTQHWLYLPTPLNILYWVTMDTTLTISTHTPQYSLLSYFGDNTDYTPLNIHYWVTLDTTLTISTHTPQYSLLSYFGHNTDYIYPHPSIFFTGLLWTQHWLYLPTPLNILYWVTMDTTLTISTNTTHYSLLSYFGHNIDYIYLHHSIFFIELLWTQLWLYLPTPLNILYWCP